jgi:hypothetical protein
VPACGLTKSFFRRTGTENAIGDIEKIEEVGACLQMNPSAERERIVASEKALILPNRPRGRPGIIRRRRIGRLDQSLGLLQDAQL